jgi:hypothetical protein
VQHRLATFAPQNERGRHGEISTKVRARAHRAAHGQKTAWEYLVISVGERLTIS